VFLSSHLLDEVEKVCDAVAIVDRGRVVAQGSVADLVRGTVIELSCSEPSRARLLLGALPFVQAVAEVADRLEVRATGDIDEAAAQIARRLVGAGLDLRRLTVGQATLEQRFLEITTRLEEAA